MWQKFLFLLTLLALSLGLTACQPRQVMAEDRLFLDLSVDFVGAVELPKTEYEGTTVGGLSGLTYDRQRDRFYAISDDRSRQAPARFYTLQLTLETTPQVTLENVTTLKNEQGNTYPENGIDPESIALSPRDTLYISSEGIPKDNIAPFIGEFNRETGQKLNELRIPKRFLPNTPIRNDNPPHGVQDNLGFEALALGITSVAEADPFRLFTAPEFSLIQDDIEHTPDTQPRLRLLHYGINPVGPPILVSETLYLLEPIPESAISHGLTELIALQREGYLLSLERSFSPLTGVTAKLFQVTSGNATDTSRIDNLKSINIVEPMGKRLLFDLNTLDIPLDNLEGMALGPYFPDGSQSLIFVSDDNFREEQVTQFLVFRLYQ